MNKKRAQILRKYKQIEKKNPKLVEVIFEGGTVEKVIEEESEDNFFFGE